MTAGEASVRLTLRPCGRGNWRTITLEITGRWEWPACRDEMGPTAWDAWLGVEITRPSPMAAFLRVRHLDKWPVVVDAMFRYGIDAAWAET